MTRGRLSFRSPVYRRPASKQVVLTPKLGDGSDLGARITLDFDDEATAIRALALVARPRLLVPLARELGVEIPGYTNVTRFDDDDNDEDGTE